MNFCIKCGDSGGNGSGKKGYMTLKIREDKKSVYPT
jgi:hypothetical protein